MNKSELKSILTQHSCWLENPLDPKGRRADLSEADLYEANLHKADLSRADLHKADLYEADLYEANLHGANLRGANLHKADLYGADLSGVNLSEADLSGANLHKANLYGANLRRTDLNGANLSGADLYGAYLSEADLSEADLSGANLHKANLHKANITNVWWPAPTAVLLAQWGNLPEDLVADLMRYNAANHPDPTAFDRWSTGGPCPYDKVFVQRAALFTEQQALWSPGPCPRPYDLMVRVLAACCPSWDNAKRKRFHATFRTLPTGEETNEL